MKKKPFSERHPRWNIVIGLILVACMIVGGAKIFLWLFTIAVEEVLRIRDYVADFFSSTDQVIVVAMITGTVSIIGVVISSIVAKIVDYRYNVKRYLYDKKETAYKQFIEIVFTVVEDTKKTNSSKLPEDNMVKMFSELSKGLTLWGSNQVVKKYLEFRKAGLIDANEAKTDILFKVEDIIYEIRKDMGMKRRLKKGDILSIFINDMDSIKNMARK